MPDVLIRGLSKKTLDRLKARARTNNRSLQAELKSLLHRAAGEGSRGVPPEILRIRELFEGQTFPDSAEMIREDRDR